MVVGRNLEGGLVSDCIWNSMQKAGIALVLKAARQSVPQPNVFAKRTVS